MNRDSLRDAEETMWMRMHGEIRPNCVKLLTGNENRR